MESEGRLWTHRLRWRLRGGLQWPAFAVLTVGDAVLMHVVPPLASSIDLVPGLIVASFGNLFLVGAVAPWLARRLAAREPTPGAAMEGSTPPPYEVLLDRAATGLLFAGALGLLAAGLASRPLIVSETEATELNARLVREYVLGHASAEVRANVDAANTIRLAEGYFRTCVPKNDRRTVWCVLVDTNTRPPQVREDRSATPNDKYLASGSS